MLTQQNRGSLQVSVRGSHCRPLLSAGVPLCHLCFHTCTVYSYMFSACCIVMRCTFYKDLYVFFNFVRGKGLLLFSPWVGFIKGVKIIMVLKNTSTGTLNFNHDIWTTRGVIFAVPVAVCCPRPIRPTQASKYFVSQRVQPGCSLERRTRQPGSQRINRRRKKFQLACWFFYV